ncbi:MAG: dNTP triphosphohydrolase [Bacteroides cellulosilyticus]|nr:dNTP triphosphohydrolase [Bacteroides cellulosilyticus]
MKYIAPSKILLQNRLKKSSSYLFCDHLRFFLNLFKFNILIMTRFFRFSSQDGTDFLKTSYQKLDNIAIRGREHPENGNTKRNEYHRDFTRILYSPAFRRLQGKMQILGIRNDAFFRNRLTHSLEVSQIARSIATNIGHRIGNGAYTCRKDLYVIEAAALAHDIGHPAFGHSGERVLDKICQQDGTGRFEGNAQNFRILRTLEKKLPKDKGLNLTYRTLLAINKYLVEESSSAEKFMYKEDHKALSKIRVETNLVGERTLDVQIIDIADEIAYAVHDLEDALTFGYFNIDELVYLLNKEKEKLSKKSFGIFDRAVKKAKGKAAIASTYGTTQEYSQIFRRSLVSKLTNQFINDIGVVEVSEEAKKEHGTPNISQELGFCELGDLVHGLKKVIFKAICRHDHINVYEQRGATIIKGLYRIYTNVENLQMLTPDYRPNLSKGKSYSELDNAEKKELSRASVDFIAGMMDDFAKGTYERYYSVNFDSIPIVGRNFSL